MTTFEYRCESLCAQTQDELAKWLNALGEQGWELAATRWSNVPSIMINEFVPTKMIFKRKKEDR